MSITKYVAGTAFLLCAAITAPTFAQAQSDAEVTLSHEADGPTVLLDGREISQSELGSLDATGIKDIRILSAEQAERELGKYGEHGAIMVTSAGASDAPMSNRGVAVGELTPANAATPTEETITTTLNGDIEALVIIDGQPSTMDALNALQPDQIESMSVLKDEEATAPYGAVGSNGVIVVVTKQ